MNNSTANDSWYVMERGTVSGPFTQAELESMRRQGTCKSYAKVSHDRGVWKSIDEHLQEVQSLRVAPRPVSPPPHDGMLAIEVPSKGTPVQQAHRISIEELILPFPVFPLLLLHYLTASIFTFFWITASHERLPKFKSDDPGGFKAVILCFVPFFNIYWLVAIYVRLAQRINTYSDRHRLPKSVPVGLAYVMSMLLVVPVVMFTAGAIIHLFLAFSPTPAPELNLLFFKIPAAVLVLNLELFVPIFAAIVQRAFNNLSFAQLESLISAVQVGPNSN